MNILEKDMICCNKAAPCKEAASIVKSIVAVTVVVSLTLVFYGAGERVADARGRGDFRQVHIFPETHKAQDHFLRGVRYSLRKEYGKAIEAYQKSLRYNNRVALVHSNLGFVYLDKGDYNMAIASQLRALHIDPSSVNAYYGIAMAYEKKGSNEDAIKSWEKFLKIADPHTPWWKKAREQLKRLKAEQ